MKRDLKQILADWRYRLTGNNPMVEGWLYLALLGFVALIILYYGIKALVV